MMCANVLTYINYVIKIECFFYEYYSADLIRSYWPVWKKTTLFCGCKTSLKRQYTLEYQPKAFLHQRRLVLKTGYFNEPNECQTLFSINYSLVLGFEEQTNTLRTWEAFDTVKNKRWNR